MKTRVKLLVLYLFSFIASVTPLVVTFVLNREEYIKTPAEAMKLCTGGAIAVFFVFLKAIGKLKMPRGIVLYSVILGMAYLLDAVLDDLMLLSGMALIGELIDVVVFRPLIRRTEENAKAKKCAEITAAQMETVLDKYVGRT